MGIIIQLIVSLLIAGFIYMIWLKCKPLVAQVVAEPFLTIIDILIWILIAGIILFYVIIPLLYALGGMAGGGFKLPKFSSLAMLPVL